MKLKLQLFWSFSSTESFSILATPFNPFASNQGTFYQLNPSQKILSGAARYQWHDESGKSTSHFDQSASHCGTCTQIIEANKKEKIKFIIID